MVETIRYKNKKNRFSPLMTVLFVFFMLYTVVLFSMLLWALLSTFKDRREFQISTIGLPKHFSFANYASVIDLFKMVIKTDSGANRTVYFAELVLNSVEYAVGSALLQTIVLCITAYCCARYKYVFSKIVHSTVIVLMIIPIVGTLPSSIRIAQTLGLYGKMWGMWIMNSSFLGLYFLVFYDMFKSLPASFFEAARVDGANDWHLLFKIALPLSLNGFLTVLLINFITYWNDYQTPLIYIKQNPVISYAMYNITQTVRGNVPQVLCAAIIVMLPIVILFCLANKRLMGNLTVGGVKG